MSETFYKQQPQDLAGRTCAVGSTGFSTGFDADGDWQAVNIPDGEECKAIGISCRPDDTAVYTHFNDPTEFHISFNSDGTFFSAVVGISLSVAKSAGETVCYVRATDGYKFAIMGLK